MTTGPQRSSPRGIRNPGPGCAPAQGGAPPCQRGPCGGWGRDAGGPDTSGPDMPRCYAGALPASSPPGMPPLLPRE
ncbi:hypothetical protein GCM10009840_20070 [Pseudolysinimonas kribbensis]